MFQNYLLKWIIYLFNSIRIFTHWPKIKLLSLNKDRKKYLNIRILILYTYYTVNIIFVAISVLIVIFVASAQIANYEVLLRHRELFSYICTRYTLLFLLKEYLIVRYS